MEKKQFKRRIFILSCALVLFIFIYLFEAGILTTLTRYIKREQDEIKAYYTSLYFDTNGNGKTIALENNVGYVDFSLMNYIGEDVTQRDIEYEIKRPEKFYDEEGKEIAEADLASAEKLYVLDVWGEPQEVAKSTYLYTIEVNKNTGEKVSDTKYLFSYEKLGTSAVGKTHHVNLEVSRDSGEVAAEEAISIVVQLTKPYREVKIINMTVSNRLITFSTSKEDKFGLEFDKLHIQTADLFAYSKAGDERFSQSYEQNGQTYRDKFTSKAFKITVTWSGYILDEVELEKINNGTVGKPDVTPDGTTINQDEYYLDVTKSVYVYIDADHSSGTLIMFVPQCSDFNLDFLPTSDNANVDVKIEIYVINDVNDTAGYQLYDSKFYGYTFDENNKYRVITKTSTN